MTTNSALSKIARMKAQHTQEVAEKLLTVVEEVGYSVLLSALAKMLEAEETQADEMDDHQVSSAYRVAKNCVVNGRACLREIGH